jgi:thioredoxin reductase (NADPH)
MHEYDIAIIGGGGAGLTAALYAARARRNTVLFEQLVPGGQIATTGPVENYPGFPAGGINGLELSERMEQQAREFGTVFVNEAAASLVRRDDGTFVVSTESDEYHARAVIVTAGAAYKHLGVAGEDDFVGRGVSYCATCDGAFFAGQDVVVVGGGDAALDEAEFLTRYASHVTLVHRRDTLRASALLQQRAFENPRISFMWDSVVESIEGGRAVERVILRNVKTGDKSELATAAVFIFIGQTPNTGLLAGLVPVDAGGHAIVDLQMATEVPGLFAAGDVRTLSARQLITAAGDGATAAINADHWLAAQPS